MTMELVNKLPYDHPYRWDGTAVGGVKLWRPDELGASLALWLDAEDTASITLNGGNVSQWADKSGNNRHAVQATASAQPTLTAGGIRDKNSIAFDGTTECFVLQNVGSLSASNKSLFAVIHPTSSRQIDYILDVELGRHVFSANGNVFAGTWEPISGPFTTNVEKIVGFRTGPTNLLLYQNGTLLSETGPASSVPFGGSVAVGSRFNGNSNFFAGEMAEVVFVNGAISTEDRQKLEGYLAWKWGLVANLPAGHPYKSAPPTV